MPTVAEAKKMRCPYFVHANLMRANLYGWDNKWLLCSADACPKWHWLECYKDSCINKSAPIACCECEDKEGYCG